MKLNRTVWFALLMCTALAVSYWLGYQHGSRSGHHRLNSVSNLKQIGLSFRMGRNDVNGQFSMTDGVVDPKPQPK